MDKISTSRDLQASHGYTNERSLTKPRGSELGDTRKQASPVGMPQTAKEIYRIPPALGDWWILNLLNWFFLFFTATPRQSNDQSQQDSPERPASPQPTPATGSTTTIIGSHNSDCGNVTGSYNTTNNNKTYNNAEKIYGGGARNDFSGATFH